MDSQSKTTTRNDLAGQLQQIGLRALPQNLDDFLARALVLTHAARRTLPGRDPGTLLP